MRQVELKVGQDHVEAIAKVKNPLVAIEELVWNSLDADATRVEVTLSISDIGALEKVVVKDNGLGIRYSDCERVFENLGNSPKLTQRTTPGGRLLHGKLGKGRFRAFGVGRSVTWVSRYRDNGSLKQFSVRGFRSTLKHFEIGDEKAVEVGHSGVEVVVASIDQNFPSLTNSESAAIELSRRLALYLKQYPGITILYDDQSVDPSELEASTATYELHLTNAAQELIPAELTIIEWKTPTDRALYLCDEFGFTLDERSPGIRAPGFNFTAYLKSKLISELVNENAFALDQMHPVVNSIMADVKEILRKHFREREASRLSDLVRQWKDEQVYPYSTPAQDPLARAEREVFDVCAIKVHEYLPGFEKSDAKAKKLTFRLVREALERSPGSLHRILHEVLNLPQDQQEDLAAILERTRLGAIIHAAKTVVDRLDFLGSLDSLLFGEFKKTLLERKQLHRILAQELWIFGEQYNLGVDDQSLRSVLEKHIGLMGRGDLSPEVGDDVTDLEGKNRIVDLMLYNQYPLSVPETFEHLVVELKRPDCKLGKDEISQIENYAFTVADDERFDKSRTRWTFLLVGNDLTSFGENKCKVQGREFGHIHASDDGAVNIYVRRWSSIISQAKWRYQFFRDKLELQVTTEDGLQYLRKKYAKYIPSEDADVDSEEQHQ